MDPFEVINPFLHEFVLQHFDASEVLHKLSFVSTEWNQIIGSSKKCMNKIRFIYQIWRHQFYSYTEVFQCVQNSLRKYQNINVELGVEDDAKEFWNFIETCSRLLVTLKVENIRRPREVCESLEFPNLEVYMAYGLDAFDLTSVLKSTKKLKNIFISSSDASMNSMAIETIIKCLQNNRNLEELYLKNVSFVNIFERPLEVNFHLKSLKLMSTSTTSSISSDIEKNLLKFLNQQSSTLETFFFDFSSEAVLEYAFSKLPALNSIGFLNGPSSSLETNHRIINLEIPFIEEMSEIKKFVDSTPNLETLFVRMVTTELIDYLAWSFMKLKFLSFKLINVDAELHYEQLKTDHPEVNQNIDIWDYENVDWD